MQNKFFGFAKGTLFPREAVNNIGLYNTTEGVSGMNLNGSFHGNVNVLYNSYHAHLETDEYINKVVVHNNGNKVTNISFTTNHGRTVRVGISNSDSGNWTVETLTNVRVLSIGGYTKSGETHAIFGLDVDYIPNYTDSVVIAKRQLAVVGFFTNKSIDTLVSAQQSSLDSKVSTFTSEFNSSTSASVSAIKFIANISATTTVNKTSIEEMESVVEQNSETTELTKITANSGEIGFRMVLVDVYQGDEDDNSDAWMFPVTEPQYIVVDINSAPEIPFYDLTKQLHVQMPIIADSINPSVNGHRYYDPDYST